ncbi:ABC transporter ATP-binding protein [Brevibacillus brevis]|uniref:ABC transporter ATP-binding protein n=1 Tax=Brevibacillus brevis TaxID=1393 RepID=UPI0007D89C15|nr:ABC transporter ATP-binding protein [Brevibacillus brevis]WGV60538.1 ABC transporter ATP-binding protein [Brevibacillus brevis]WJQ82031.1 ABC transporter ATP-binding protein [Brevibacillus brevis]
MNSARVKGVSKKFGDVTALHHLDLQIGQGEFVALLGPSGCGKTTLLRLLAGFESPTSGEIWINQECVADQARRKPPEERRIGMVFQSFALWPHLTVYENVVFPLQHQKHVPAAYKDKPKARVAQMLEMVGLGGMEERFPNQLSGGQKQRVALARAIVFNPTLLLMDEPLSSLDAELRMQMRKEIQFIHRELGTSIVYVTHDQSEALAMADQIVVMKGGRVEQAGSPHDIYYSPQSPFVAKFVGRANFLKGNWSCPNTFLLERQGEPAVPIAVSRDFSSFHAQQILPVRPDQLKLAAWQQGMEGVVGKVSHVQFQGRELLYSIRVGEDDWEVVTDISQRFSYEERVCVEVCV